ncbi:arylsulfatase [Galbibacter mesophilus]|uniref:arylsulfatase n=1 Tax=Galbibacter mesophilus TaxID=379069 RepID=UPI00191FC140|nr:arylsulfatase [Galbibacter mesophilus]MCM5664117.1 arylsulfatase [Galbibacter mesophilus]
MKKICVDITCLLFVACFFLSNYSFAQEKPNVVIIVMDNLGWGEIGAYGGGILRGAETPRLDTLAKEGMQLLNFNVEPQCTPSRSALMTGRHPIRSGTTKVVWGLPYGLVGWEKTMAELFSDQGYATAMYGKWHLGDMKGRYPTDQGFDEWYGIANTTDESQYTSQPGYDPKVVSPPQIVEATKGAAPKDVKEYNVSTRRTIDEELTNKSIDFMQRQVQKDKPFFLYLPYTLAHLPTLPNPKFEGKSGNGTWGDVLMEIDHNTGRILDAIDDLKVRENTIVIWMSENGPEEAPNWFGTAGYWRGFYFTALEGSLRTPFLIRWPGKIPEGKKTNAMVHMTDVLPSLAKAAGYKVPSDRKIDGVDQMPLFTGETPNSAREGFPVYNGDEMFAYKWRNFKIHYYNQQSMFDKPVKHNFPRVHDLIRDPKELFGVHGGNEDTGAQNLTWVLPAITHEVLEFQATLQEEPPIKLGTPEPYKPKK